MHGYPYMGSMGVSGLEVFGAAGGLLIGLVLVWSLIWKGLALWHAARNGQMWWFIAILIINTMGILEIIYLFAFRTDRHTNPLFPSRIPPTPPTSSAE